MNTAPDALRDRMVTLNLPGYSEATEAAILTAHSGIDPRTARVIVAMVRDLRRQPDLTLLPSMRTALLIARIAQAERSAGRLDDTMLMTIVSDVVSGRDGACTSDHIRRAFEATGPMRGGN